MPSTKTKKCLLTFDGNGSQGFVANGRVCTRAGYQQSDSTGQKTDLMGRALEEVSCLLKIG